MSGTTTTSAAVLLAAVSLAVSACTVLNQPASVQELTSCWDGVRQGAERCDGDDFDGETCSSVDPIFGGGELQCTDGCQFDTSGCSKCGNGVVDPGEDCDGDVDGMACETLESSDIEYVGGVLSCSDDCTLDTSLCDTCGNGKRDDGEDCDGTDLGEESCTTVPGGFSEGALACRSNCRFNTSDCRRTCEVAADCDDDNPCTADTCDPTFVCQWQPVAGSCDDANPCTSGDTCNDGSCSGNSICPPNEVCDPSDLSCSCPGRRCDSTCYPGYACCPGVSGDCGWCGTRTCQGNGQWGGCTGEGQCSPGSQCFQCGNCGCGTNNFCGDNCQYPACVFEACVPGVGCC